MSPASIVNLHGLTITFTSPDIALRQRFETIYGHLPKNGPANGEIQINWQIVSESVAPPPPNLPLILEESLISYYGDQQTIAMRLPKYGLLTVDLASAIVTGQVTSNCLTVYGAFEDTLMIALAPLYRRQGWFPLHAFAALAPDRQAILICGQMGSGKTTTGLALLDAGWKLLSNDSPLLAMRGNQVEALAYPGQLSAFNDSLARFSRLKQFIATPDASSMRQKQVFSAEEAFSEPWADRGLVGAVFFPQVVPGLSRSQLIAETPKAAMLKLMPQAIDGWDKAQIPATLQLLNGLVAQVPCFTLKLSPQVEELPKLLAAAQDNHSL